MHPSSPATEIARSPAAWEQLAKDWLLEVIERSPLTDVKALPLGWIAQEAPPLIAEILGQISDPGPARELRLPPAALARAAALASERDAEAAMERIPLELAALQSLLIEAIDRELPQRDRGELGRAAVRLAEIFGAIQSTAMAALVPDRVGEAAPPGATPSAPLPLSGPTAPPATAAAPPSSLRDSIETLIAEHRHSKRPFALAHLEIEGAERISKGYGEGAADGMVTAVAGILRGQLDDSQSFFQPGNGQMVVLAPGAEPIELVGLAIRVAELVARSQGERGPRVNVVAGIAGFPANGESAEALLEAAEEAAWAARATGDQVSMAPGIAMQDP